MRGTLTRTEFFKYFNRGASVMFGFTYSHTPFVLTKWLTRILVDRRFNKSEINEVCIELTLKRMQE